MWSIAVIIFMKYREMQQEKGIVSYNFLVNDRRWNGLATC